MRKCMVLPCTCIRVQGSCNHAVTQHRQSPWPADEQPGLAVSRRDHDDAAEGTTNPTDHYFPPHLSTPRTPPDASAPSLLICFVKRFLSRPRPWPPAMGLCQSLWIAARCRQNFWLALAGPLEARGLRRALRHQQRAARGNADGVPETAEGSPWRARTHWRSALAACTQIIASNCYTTTGNLLQCADGTRTRPGK